MQNDKVLSDKLKQVVKFGGAYGLANVYHQVLMLLVIPVYTEYLSTEDYGIAGLMSITAGFILALTKTPASYGLSRHYFAPGFEDKRGELLLGSVTYAFIQSIILALLFYLFSDFFAGVILEDTKLDHIIKIYCIIILLQPLEEIFQDLAKLQKKAKLLSIIHACNITFSIALTLVLLLVFDLKVMALIWGAVSITVFTVIALLPNTLRNIKWKFDIKVIKISLGFGFPLIIAVISLYTMKNVDIYIIKSILDVPSAGQYHFGYKFGALLNFFFVLPLKNIIEPLIYELENEPDKLRKFVSDTGTYFFTASMILCVGISLFSQELLLLLASKAEFQAAWVIVPVIAFAHVNFAMMDIFGRGLIMTKRSMNFSSLYFAGAIVNIALNYLLIPVYGILGAALATLAAYMFISIISAILSKKHFNQNFEWSKIIFTTILGLAVYFVSLTLEFGIFVNVILKFVLLAVFVILALKLVITKEQKNKYISLIKKKLNR